MKKLAVLSVFLVSLSAFASVDPGMVTVSSTYPDETNPSRRVIVQGSGFLVQDAAKVYVLTASHVSQGDDLKITSNGTSLAVIGRYYNGLNDAEILEVDATASPLVPTVEFTGSYFKWTPPTPLPPFEHRARRVDQFNWILLNDWTFDRNLDQDNQTQESATGLLRCDFYCAHLTGTTLVQPGASGSPLVTRIPLDNEWTRPDLPFDILELIPRNAGDYALRGMAVRRDRFFAQSSFVPASVLKKIVVAYQSGERGNPVQTPRSPKTASWHVAGNLQFRVTSSDLQESQIISGSSGNGSSIDGGDGLAELREDSPKAVLSEIAAWPFSNDERQSIVLWIFAMRDPRDNELLSVPMWFDMEHYLALGPFSMGLISADPPGTPLLFERARTRATEDPVLLTSADGGGDLRITRQTADVTVRLQNGATLTLSFDVKGALCEAGVCASGFMPIVEARASDGETYIVDLRSLFMHNPTASTSSAFRDRANLNVTEDNWLGVWMGAVYEDLNTLRLFYRKKRSDAEAQQPMTMQQGTPIQLDWKLR